MQEEKGYGNKAKSAGPLGPGLFRPVVWPQPSLPSYQGSTFFFIDIKCFSFQLCCISISSLQKQLIRDQSTLVHSVTLGPCKTKVSSSAVLMVEQFSISSSEFPWSGRVHLSATHTPATFHALSIGSLCCLILLLWQAATMVCLIGIWCNSSFW